jgi:hypothetical protein
MMSLGVDCTADNVRLIRILDTLNLTRLEASAALALELQENPQVLGVSDPEEIEFNSDGGLKPLGGQ